MIKYVLVPATGSDVDQTVFRTALAVARPWAAHIEFLHVRIDVEQVLAAMSSTDIGGGLGYSGTFVSLEMEATARQEAAEHVVRKFWSREQIPLSSAHDGAGTTAEWCTEIGDEAACLTEHGRLADLVVIGRAREGEPVAMDLLEAALLATGRPILLAADKPLRVKGGTVAIAWKDTPEAARAVDAARPFIDTAGQVVILSVQEDGAADDKSCERLAEVIRWRNRNVAVRRLSTGERTAADVLIYGAASVGANLLVMGGYSHSRLREMVLGGFTRRILQGCELPVLMAH
jgi:nucleotide-binding universal stress UspA family protein